jgi:replication factor A3
MDKPTPRIDQSIAYQFAGKTVRVVGRVESIDPSEGRIKFYSPSPNNEHIVNLHYTPDLKFEKGKWYECICRVTQDAQVRAIDNVDIGEDINEKALAGLIKYTHSAAQELFYDPSEHDY